jgi:ribosomal protein S12 methylthiotransferase
MSEVASPERIAPPAAPKAGFVSLGSPRDTKYIYRRSGAIAVEISAVVSSVALFLASTCPSRVIPSLFAR